MRRLDFKTGPDIKNGKINSTWVNKNYREIEDQLYNIKLVNWEVSKTKK